MAKGEFQFATTEQIQAWKQTHGELNVHGFTFKAIEKWPAMVGYFRTPNITEVSLVQAKVESDPGGSFDAICKSCFLGGDALILENGIAKTKIATHLIKCAGASGEMEILNV